MAMIRLMGHPVAYERVEGVWGNREVPPRQVLRRGLVGVTLRGFHFRCNPEEGVHGGTRGSPMLETWFPPRERAEGKRRSCRLGEQRLALPDVPRRADGTVELERPLHLALVSRAEPRVCLVRLGAHLRAELGCGDEIPCRMGARRVRPQRRYRNAIEDPVEQLGSSERDERMGEIEEPESRGEHLLGAPVRE